MRADRHCCCLLLLAGPILLEDYQLVEKLANVRAPPCLFKNFLPCLPSLPARLPAFQCMSCSLRLAYLCPWLVAFATAALQLPPA